MLIPAPDRILLTHAAMFAAIALFAWPAAPAHAQSGTWINTATSPGDWGAGANWSGGTIANGADFTANFTANITVPMTVNLDAPRTIGNITFTDSASSHDLTISGGNILTLDRTDATKPTIDVTQSGRTLNISSVIAGNDGLRKIGAGDLIMSGANNFTGGIDLAGGRIVIFDNANEQSFLGAASNVLTFTGNATLFNSNNTVILPQGITINGGVTANVTGAFGERTQVDGVLAGSGTLNVEGFSADFRAEFRNTANTFTGPITVNSVDFMTLGVRSLADSANTIGLDSQANNGGKFEYLSGAIAPLVLNNRQFELIVNGNALTNLSRQPSIVNNAGLANTMTINTNLLVTGTGLKRFVLEGSNAGDNTFAGVIPDAIGADVLHLYKQGGGKWLLAGANTFEGITTVSGGTLGLANVNALQNSTLDTGTSGTQLVTFNLAGNNTYNIGGLQGTDALAIGANTISLGANGASTTFNGNISGTGGLSKVGAGTLTLAATNGYSGATSVLGGTLALDASGSISSSTSVQIGAGGILDTTAQSFTMLGSQPFTFEIDPTGAGLVGLLNAATLDITAGEVSFDLLGVLDDPAYEFASYSSLLGASFSSVALPAGYTLDFNYLGGNTIALVQQLDAVPEPASIALWSLLGLGLVGAGARHARRKMN